MKVGFDGKRAVSNMTGLGNYSRLVIERMAETFPDDTFYVYTPALKANPRLAGIKSLSNVEFHTPPPMGFSGSLWRTFGISNHLRPDGIDIYHGLSNELPLNIRNAGVASVVTVHDVIYRRVPECYNPLDRKIYDYKYGRSCRNATRIIAISERTRQDIIELYGIFPEKIDVIYQGCDESFKCKCSPAEFREVRQRLGLPERYLLQVGTIESRKNLELSVRALASVPADITLVAVGRDRKGYKKHVEGIARECGVSGRVVFLNEVAFRDLPALNQMAEVILYPSRYEGFGIPVIEGLESGRPVVAASGSCLEEAGGNAARYVAPDDPRALAEIINAILSDSGLAADMVEKGFRQAKRFDTSAMADSIMEVYRKAIGEYNLTNNPKPKNFSLPDLPV